MSTERHHQERFKHYRRDHLERLEEEWGIPQTQTPDFDLTDIKPSLEFTTNSLRERLAQIDLRDPWLLHRASIYELAISSLARILQITPTPNPDLTYLAFEELHTMTEILSRLFSGQIKLRPGSIGEDTIKTKKYTGYTNLLTANGTISKRIIIDQILADIYSKKRGRIIHASTQIEVQDIIGMSDRGRAIASDDSAIRCGLRHTADETAFHWTVSIDSGLRSVDENQWKIVRPLSQAIQQAKKWPDSGIGFEDGEYTYHFDEHATTLNLALYRSEKGHWLRKFFSFINFQNQIFESMT